MGIFRPSNINKRVSGTKNVSPGNAGVIGPTTTPYCVKNACCPTIQLGARYFGGGGSNPGVFKISESVCGVKEGCKSPFNPANDCKGFFICCSGATKIFVAPCCTQAYDTWYSRSAGVSQANNCMGSLSWYLPDCAGMLNPGYCCNIYWDCCCNTSFWTNSQGGPGNCNFMAYQVNPANGGAGQGIQSNCTFIRVFRNV